MHLHPAASLLLNIEVEERRAMLEAAMRGAAVAGTRLVLTRSDALPMEAPTLSILSGVCGFPRQEAKFRPLVYRFGIESRYPFDNRESFVEQW